jgi:hypothetical protein
VQVLLCAKNPVEQIHVLVERVLFVTQVKQLELDIPLQVAQVASQLVQVPLTSTVPFWQMHVLFPAFSTLGVVQVTQVISVV